MPYTRPGVHIVEKDLSILDVPCPEGIRSKESYDNWVKLLWQYENYPKRYSSSEEPKEETICIKWYHNGKLE